MNKKCCKFVVKLVVFQIKVYSSVIFFLLHLPCNYMEQKGNKHHLHLQPVMSHLPCNFIEQEGNKHHFHHTEIRFLFHILHPNSNLLSSNCFLASNEKVHELNNDAQGSVYSCVVRLLSVTAFRVEPHNCDLKSLPNFPAFN